MTSKSFLIWPLLLFLFADDLCAQQHYLGVEYNVTVPRGETAEFVDETSYTGMGFSFFVPDTTNFTWGVSFQLLGWMESEDFVSIEKDGAIFSGPQERTYLVYPFQFKGRYQIGPFPFKPYLGVGAGIAYVEQTDSLGFFVERDIENQGVLSSEIGFIYYMGRINVNFGSHYIASVTRDDLASFEGLETFLSLGFITD
jgi:hypothetical protein